MKMKLDKMYDLLQATVNEIAPDLKIGIGQDRVTHSTFHGSVYLGGFFEINLEKDLIDNNGEFLDAKKFIFVIKEKILQMLGGQKRLIESQIKKINGEGNAKGIEKTI